MMLYVWIALTVVFILLEAISVQLTSVWFALGSLAALIVTVCGVDSIPIQIAVFAAVSLASLILTRPLVKKLLNKKVQPTNADRSIGQKAIVTEEIVNIEGKGAVKLNGTEWTARSAAADDRIEKGAEVQVLKIEGVKLIVERI